jgi:hypothetical protein
MRWFIGFSIAFWFTSAYAQSVFQDWLVGNSDATSNVGAYSYAGTMNSTNDSLDEYCYQKDKHCEWRITTTVSCTPGNESAVIINGTNSFDLIKTFCLGALRAGTYTYKLGSWKSLEDTLSTSNKVAFVFSLQDSAVYVARFSCAGSIPATAAAGGPIVGERHNQGMSPASATSSTVL